MTGPMNLIDNFPAWIKQRRKENGITLGVLSARCGLSISYLSDIERGRTIPSLNSIQSIVEALGFKLTWSVDNIPTDKYWQCKQSIWRAIEMDDWASVLLYLSGMMAAKGDKNEL